MAQESLMWFLPEDTKHFLLVLHSLQYNVVVRYKQMLILIQEAKRIPTCRKWITRLMTFSKKRKAQTAPENYVKLIEEISQNGGQNCLGRFCIKGHLWRHDLWTQTWLRSLMVREYNFESLPEEEGSFVIARWDNNEWKSPFICVPLSLQNLTFKSTYAHATGGQFGQQNTMLK